MTQIYVSTDIEADGPIPGQHSMLGTSRSTMLSVRERSSATCCGKR